MRRGLSAAALALGLGLAGLAATRQAEPDTAPLRRAIGERWGITIQDTALDATIAPLVARADRPVHLQDLSTSHAPAALGALQEALSVYPSTFVRRLLRRVALADDITVWGKEAGGLFADATIVINANGIENPAGYRFAVDTVHHELSSLVRRQVSFDRTAWQAANPQGFIYAEDTARPQDIDVRGDPAGDPALHRAGFVNAYGQTDLDNDWNTYAQAVFGHGAEFAAELARFPAMRPKARMLIDIYLSLEPGLTEYFTRTGLSRAAQADP